MSLTFKDEETLEELSISCSMTGNSVFIRTPTYDMFRISLIDFLFIVDYVLTNTDLREDDPRIKFLERFKTMEETQGYNGPESRRLLPSHLIGK